MVETNSRFLFIIIFGRGRRHCAKHPLLRVMRAGSSGKFVSRRIIQRVSRHARNAPLMPAPEKSGSRATLCRFCNNVGLNSLRNDVNDDERDCVSLLNDFARLSSSLLTNASFDDSVTATNEFMTFLMCFPQVPDSLHECFTIMVSWILSEYSHPSSYRALFLPRQVCFS